MIGKTFFEDVRIRLHRFCVAREGNVLITFALALVPLMGFVGVAVDYSRANSAKASMQAAVDATALMLSKDASTLTSAQLSQKAANYFNAQFTRTDVSNIVLTPSYTTTGGTQLSLGASGVMTNLFMKVVGNQTANIAVSSTVSWGNSRLRVARSSTIPARWLNPTK
jgi:Flp pilus assembly protein TadG